MSKADATVDIDLIAYTIAQAAAALGIDIERMSGLISAGVVPHIALGNRRVVGKRALEQWLTDACMANASPVAQLPPPKLQPLRRRTKPA